MSFPDCPVHNLIQNIVYSSENGKSMFCFECFRNHGDNITGVMLKEQSRNVFLEWNQFLLGKFTKMGENLKVRGYTALFEMKIDSQYPKGLLNDLSNNEIDGVVEQTIEQYRKMLQGNIHFVSNVSSLADLKIPDFLKDLYLLFACDINKNLGFILGNIHKKLQERYPNKEIYLYVRFNLPPKESRVLDNKRRDLIKKVENDVMVKFKKPISSPLSRSRNSEGSREDEKRIQSPRFTRTGEQRVNKTVLTPSSKREEPSNFFIINSEKKKENIQDRADEFDKTIENEEEVEKLKQEVMALKEELLNKDKSIKMLNTLIGNEEEELNYRESEVEMLSEEIKKLMSLKKEEHPELLRELAETKEELTLREKSIRELNALIANEEEELSYRENEVDILSEEIKKLMKWKQLSEELQATNSELQAKLKEKDASIKQLNSLIGNEEEELVYRESEVETLTEEITKLMSYKDKYLTLQKENEVLLSKNEGLMKQLEQEKNREKVVSYDEQLLEDVVKLEADVASRNDDIRLLSKLLNNFAPHLPPEHQAQLRDDLKSLRSIRAQDH